MEKRTRGKDSVNILFKPFLANQPVPWVERYNVETFGTEIAIDGMSQEQDGFSQSVFSLINNQGKSLTFSYEKTRMVSFLLNRIIVHPIFQVEEEYMRGISFHIYLASQPDKAIRLSSIARSWQIEIQLALGNSLVYTRSETQIEPNCINLEGVRWQDCQSILFSYCDLFGNETRFIFVK